MRVGAPASSSVEGGGARAEGETDIFVSGREKGVERGGGKEGEGKGKGGEEAEGRRRGRRDCKRKGGRGCEGKGPFGGERVGVGE